eukprot:s4021_g1.t1
MRRPCRSAEISAHLLAVLLKLGEDTQAVQGVLAESTAGLFGGYVPSDPVTGADIGICNAGRSCRSFHFPSAAPSTSFPPHFGTKAMDDQQVRASRTPGTESDLRLPLSFRLLSASAFVLLILGGVVFGLYHAVPGTAGNAGIQELLFALACMTMLVGCLAWMVLVRCQIYKRSIWSSEELRDIRPVQEHIWASLCFGSLEKASPDFRLMRIREGCAHPVKRAKASVIPASLKPQETCLCCLEEFEESDTVALLPCGHAFHEACITEWFLSARSSGACPICRQHLNIV